MSAKEVAAQDDAELVAFRVGENNVVGVSGLSDVEMIRVPKSIVRSSHHCSLVLHRLADQIQVDRVFLRGLWFPHGNKGEGEASAISGQDPDLVGRTRR